MTDQNPTPQWYAPRGGTTTDPRPVGTFGQPTEPVPTWPPAPPAPPGNSMMPAMTTPPAPRRGRRLAELTAVAVITGLIASGSTLAITGAYNGTDAATTTGTSQSLGRNADAAPVVQADGSAPNWTATASAVSPSVVAITATSAQGGGQGSGVIIDSSGHVLTNNHVVAGAQELTVTTSDGRTFAAEIRGTDPSTDLAVITITGNPSNLTPIAVGDSDAIAVGDPVMAVGNPLGLAGTVTTGIVSALNRPVTTQGESSGQDQFGQAQSQAEPVVTNAIQTSAAINPGNSGGALVNAGGQLIGINSSIASLGSSSGQSGNIGIGFAIPVNEATSIAEQLIAKGTAVHAYLGVTPQDGSASDGSATRTGAEITSVGADTPASKAGLQVGDVVTAVGGERVESALSLVAHIRERSAGDEVTLTVLRDGKTIDVKTTLAAKPTTTSP
ncbi:trypsin-like peptidase domain-containing protein [Ornithinibacter sp.]|jgi:putative serine protease PepD|uniref:S1C family serine protease n=1 Tax=Ornithinibacter sp. TaxID=2862748 RepID=UPI001B52F87B|nr:trypsin-like peptidase domain-containing protein [Ornithinibacter sp.]MBP6524369.1 trypsin-like peptidase domain-containing protein [Dermatophilaceae bacterium]MBU9943694.1 trypsin-like peptidase domain-containing protein [Dermatophilaceae bacterium]HOB79400.1 trypsin-like peptidase domain-containing protein [Ornithinibacter sp.]HQA13136.1 trypsin-like peptidase domain-containing protein [Ornithinibacter sp.]HQD67695.1 trypsin-like peptidase domain-containing protein [Ornithinibacter sp.]